MLDVHELVHHMKMSRVEAFVEREGPFSIFRDHWVEGGKPCYA
jgi:hypothetical protein